MERWVENPHQGLWPAELEGRPGEMSHGLHQVFSTLPLEQATTAMDCHDFPSSYQGCRARNLRDGAANEFPAVSRATQHLRERLSQQFPKSIALLPSLDPRNLGDPGGAVSSRAFPRARPRRPVHRRGAAKTICRDRQALGAGTPVPGPGRPTGGSVLGRTRWRTVSPFPGRRKFYRLAGWSHRASPGSEPPPPPTTPRGPHVGHPGEAPNQRRLCPRALRPLRCEFQPQPSEH